MASKGLKTTAMLKADPTEVFVYEGERFTVLLTEVRGMSVWERFFDIEVWDAEGAESFCADWDYVGCLSNDLVMKMVETLVAMPRLTKKSEA